LTTLYHKGNWEWAKLLHDITTEKQVKMRSSGSGDATAGLTEAMGNMGMD